MTQNEIICALVQRTEAARKVWMADQSPANLAEWDRHLGAVKVVSEILEENSRKLRAETEQLINQQKQNENLC